jgi:ABC-2 type transport system permease protein
LRGPFALAWRLNRSALVAWSCAYLVLGLVVGNLAASVDSFAQSPQARDMIQKLGGHTNLVDAFYATEIGMTAVITSVFALQTLLRVRGEEAAGRAESLLATATPRAALLGSHLAVAVGGAIWLTLVEGLTAGGMRAATSHDVGQLGAITTAALAQLPAVLVMIALTAAAFGLRSRAIAAGWVLLTAFLLTGELGPLLKLPDLLLQVSPYTHSPRLPGGTLDPVPLLVLLAVAAALLAVAFRGFRGRDLEGA